MSARAFAFALAGTALACAGGCANAVVFTTTTSTGLEINALEGAEQTVRLGYERREGVTMPGRKSDGSVTDGTYPVCSFFAMDSGSFLLPGLGTLKMHQLFVTGNAAVIVTGGREAPGGTGPGAELWKVEPGGAGVNALSRTFTAAGNVFEPK